MGRILYRCTWESSLVKRPSKANILGAATPTRRFSTVWSAACWFGSCKVNCFRFLSTLRKVELLGSPATRNNTLTCSNTNTHTKREKKNENNHPKWLALTTVAHKWKQITIQPKSGRSEIPVRHGQFDPYRNKSSRLWLTVDDCFPPPFLPFV